jgi:hypothetical protein
MSHYFREWMRGFHGLFKQGHLPCSDCLKWPYPSGLPDAVPCRPTGRENAGVQLLDQCTLLTPLCKFVDVLQLVMFIRLLDSLTVCLRLVVESCVRISMYTKLLTNSEPG